MDSGWITASFGLGGVIVGGFLTAGTEAATHWKRRRRAARAGSRLVLAEITLIGAHVTAALASGIYGPEAERPLSTEQWSSHNVALADALRDELWKALSGAYTNVARLEVLLDMQRPRPMKLEPLRESDRDVYASVKKTIDAAVADLEKFLS
jgi:hypothetical protein